MALKPALWVWPNSSITRVIDGDSVVGRMTADIGFHGLVTFEQKMRLNRINAAKKGTARGNNAVAELIRVLVGSVNTLTFETIKPYKYGDEWMVEIIHPVVGNISDFMVTNGWAVYWDGTGPRPSDV